MVALEEIDLDEFSNITGEHVNPWELYAARKEQLISSRSMTPLEYDAVIDQILAESGL